MRCVDRPRKVLGWTHFGRHPTSAHSDYWICWLATFLEAILFWEWSCGRLPVLRRDSWNLGHVVQVSREILDLSIQLLQLIYKWIRHLQGRKCVVLCRAVVSHDLCLAPVHLDRGRLFLFHFSLSLRLVDSVRSVVQSLLIITWMKRV